MRFGPKTVSGQPRFFWRGVLILLPLALLAGVGIWSLRQDRLMAEGEARARCQQAATRYAQSMTSEIWLRTNPPISRIAVDEKGRLLRIDNSSSKAVFPDRLRLAPLNVQDLTPEQRSLWNKAVVAEARQQTNVSDCYAAFLDTKPPELFQTAARYSIAMATIKSKPASAHDLLQRVCQDASTTTESGIPYSVLARYQLWRIHPQFDKLTYAICEDLIQHPTLLSRQLLSEISGTNSDFLTRWQRDQAARDFYASIAPRLADKERGAQSGWVAWSGENWFMMQTPFEGGRSIAAVPATQIEKAVANAIPPEQNLLPYAETIISIGGKEFPSSNPPGPLLATATALLGDNTDATVVVSEFLGHPAILYAEARKRTLWFTALIAVSTAAALIGFVSAYRGFCQQCRLNEMKSDFVSSVSHELRAPIASMHLMAESLERGKITEAARQKEYYGLMAQESRRLAMLIENILDFSRIERGGKKYQIEPANLNALARDTVRVMQHSATERQVQLDLLSLAAEKADSVPCDALAIQQALVNLIDNAIKHSPARGRVSVGVENGGTNLSLWVEDHGAGIPREDHERIFERFYRRGTELRRETQGIGIGLAIVKHIVDGHRGRITVRSAPGEGSRFTIELPGEYEH